MDYETATTSIVFAGEGFSPSLFRAGAHIDILGEPETSSQVVTPVISQHTFPDTGYRVLVTPERIDISHLQGELFPPQMLEVVGNIKVTLEQVDVSLCSGVGYNLIATVSQEVLGMTGNEFCRAKFLNISDVENKFEMDNFLANTAKIIFEKNGIRYSVDVDPHFQTNGEKLHIKSNAHMNLSDKLDINAALGKCEEIKAYFQSLGDRVVDSDGGE